MDRLVCVLGLGVITFSRESEMKAEGPVKEANDVAPDE